MSNREDLEAINTYVENRSRPAGGAPQGVVDKWESLVAKWRAWYPGVMGSWYVSDSDLANGKAMRDSLMRNANPDAWQYVQETAADRPDRKKYEDRPDAPGKQDKPWEKKGLKYRGKGKGGRPTKKADILDFQQKANDAGYTPPLKVDGKWGEKSELAWLWWTARGPQTPAAQMEMAAKKAAEDVAARGKPRPKEREVAPPPRYRTAAVLLPALGLETFIGGSAGAAAGFWLGGPVGAALGGALGYLGGQFLKRPES